jgi:Holin of 3TMs, for gene-transfer release
MSSEIEVKSESEKKKEDWMNSKWRPMMGWMYMLVCTMDFVGFPVLWSLLQMVSHGNVGSQWQPLTLQGAGLFHIAMGAVIGISAYGRTQEKLGGANNGGISLGAGTTYVPPGQGQVNQSNSSFGGNTSQFSGSFGGNTSQFNGSTSAGGFGTQSGSFGSSTTAPAFGSTSAYTPPAPTPVTGQVASGFGGKAAPIQAPDPII